MFSTKWFDGYENLSDSFEIRREVFCGEQGLSEDLEFDGSDDEAVLVVVYDSDKPVATGRIIRAEDGNMLLGRIAVKKEFRGNKYGDLVVRMLIRRCFDKGFKKQYVHSQVHAVPFYEKLGFIKNSEEYLEAGTPHITMVHDGDVSVCGS